MIFIWNCSMFLNISNNCKADIKPEFHFTTKGITVYIKEDNKIVFSPIERSSPLLAIQPSGTTKVKYKISNDSNGVKKLLGGSAVGLKIYEEYRSITPQLIERTVIVSAQSDQRYYLEFGWKSPSDTAFYSFLGEEKASKKYSPSCSGPEFGDYDGGQTFPFLGVRSGNKLYGLIGDSPGMWENRSFMFFDLEDNFLSLCNGNGSARRTISFPLSSDAVSVYRSSFDGWQHIEQGETQKWKTWIFTSDVESLYDVQLAAHIALANAKGFTQSGIEAILRNTSYLLLRRNLLRPESNYIFISGVGYGWKQWVTDGFYMSQGLADKELDREALNAVFFERLNYEDNCQYYLIWSLLVKRGGGILDMRTVERAYRFMRDNENDGIYFPPRLSPALKNFKTYHDQLPYEDDDAPSSNQGFHCGALMAAKELGFPVTDDEIVKSIAGYQRMFNKEAGFMATSLKQQDYIGQDALYGEVLTYVVFGQKLLPDEMVQSHIKTSLNVQSNFGMRIISKADGDLLDGHRGVYTFGGSWFLNDAANYLDGLIHGMDVKLIDDMLIWRLEKELAYMPAFHESISTVTGKPHGQHLYSWNSGYWWLRKEIRNRMGLVSLDPVEIQIDKDLGIVHHNGYLVLNPKLATLRPVEIP